MTGAAADNILRRRRVARQVGSHLGSLSTVAVLVFGSVASGYVDDSSDLDMLVVCREFPTLEARRAATSRLGKGWVLRGATGDPMFPVIDEGGSVAGVPVTLHYQVASWIEDVLASVITQGALSTEQLPFRPYTLAGLLQRAWVLEDEEGRVARWQQELTTFPSLLKQNLLAHFAPRLKEQVAELVGSAERRLGPRVFIFHLNWAVDALIGVLYALNEIYDPADKHAERTIWPYFSHAPANFSARLADILRGPFDDKTAVKKAELFEALSREVVP